MLLDSLQEIRELGLKGTAFRIGWELQKRSGLTGYWTRFQSNSEKPLNEKLEWFWADRLPFADPLSVADALQDRVSLHSKNKLLERAEGALTGRILCFGKWVGEFGAPTDWHRDPKTGLRRDPKVNWSQALEEGDDQGDVKLLWEAARFPHAYHIARAAAFFPDAAPGFAKALSAQMEDFAAANSVGRGIHWASGQEIAVRYIAWLFALDALLLSSSVDHRPSEVVRHGLYKAAQHVKGQISYARNAVYNNHLVAEGLLLYVAGALLNGNGTFQRLRKEGEEILTKECARQFYSDGGYIQLSHNYHRVALQYLLLAIAFARSTGNQVHAQWLSALARSLDFLLAHQNPNDGRLPNYGSNDGALPMILSTCDFSDFRPTLQAASVACRGERAYKPGPWDEEAAWLFGPQCLDLPLRRPKSISVSFGRVGFHVLRSKQEKASFAAFRCGSIRDRFSQIDMLHLDVFYKGENVLIDGGSYLYNGPPEWHNHFMETSSHNTVVVDGRDQMLHFRKFKCLYWTRAELLGFDENGDWSTTLGVHHGYQRYPGNCEHRRAIAFHATGLGIVRDTVTGLGIHRVRLHWLTGPFPHRFDAPKARLILQTPAGEFSIQMLRKGGKPATCDLIFGSESPPRGWVSRYYAEKRPVPSVASEVEEHCPVQFVTVFGPGQPAITMGPKLICVQSMKERFLLEMTSEGGLRPLQV